MEDFKETGGQFNQHAICSRRYPCSCVNQGFCIIMKTCFTSANHTYVYLNTKHIEYKLLNYPFIANNPFQQKQHTVLQFYSQILIHTVHKFSYSYEEGSITSHHMARDSLVMQAWCHRKSFMVKPVMRKGVLTGGLTYIWQIKLNEKKSYHINKRN